jgi:hypothetical protein
MIDPALMAMVAFDIETTGLDPLRHRMTAASLFNGRGLCKSYVFKGENMEEDRVLAEEFMAHLDEAPKLCAFNGIRFDIPFIAKSLHVPPARVHAWVYKTFDVFETCKLGLGKTFSLARLLSANGLESKTGSGLEAIQLARERRWGELASYCLQDTRLTFLVSSQRAVVLPIRANERVMVLDHSHPSLFVLW